MRYVATIDLSGSEFHAPVEDAVGRFADDWLRIAGAAPRIHTYYVETALDGPEDENGNASMLPHVEEGRLFILFVAPEDHADLYRAGGRFAIEDGDWLDVLDGEDDGMSWRDRPHPAKPPVASGSWSAPIVAAVILALVGAAIMA